MSSTAEVILSALYLRGAPRPTNLPRRGWPELVAAIRREGASVGQAPEVLRRIGATMPAAILETPKLLAWAENVVEADSALTVVSEGYPSRWLETLGDLAPPALWRNGPISEGKWIGAVGSREIDPHVSDYMAEVGRETAKLGHGLVSGGAIGCDTAAEEAALSRGAPVLRILPHGLMLRPEMEGATHLSLAAPYEPFTRALAMERNVLIYGASELTVVGHAQMRKGGTWYGATEALRRRLTRLLLRPEDSAAFRALRALGAGQLKDPADLGFALASLPTARTLFTYENRRRRAYRGDPVEASTG